MNISLFSGTAVETSVTVLARNLSSTSYYPQKVTWNGKSLVRAWLKHEEIAHGGELEFYMGDNPTGWDIGARPWSMSAWPLYRQTYCWTEPVVH
jgi:putative alpha-1,2-mannosidase